MFFSPKENLVLKHYCKRFVSKYCYTIVITKACYYKVETNSGPFLTVSAKKVYGSDWIWISNIGKFGVGFFEHYLVDKFLFYSSIDSF